MPGYPCPSTPTVYRYIDRGLLDISNIDLPMKLKRRRNKRHHIMLCIERILAIQLSNGLKKLKTEQLLFTGKAI
ncbi:transposase [Lactobacillus amylovorus]|uniref:Transposase n=1 Tax=Lactobacillus amylovorus TaxID=1604 RepID=F0TEV3_LACAM|nr:transposase [Lactobacillus amylovorus]